MYACMYACVPSITEGLNRVDIEAVLALANVRRARLDYRVVRALVHLLRVVLDALLDIRGRCLLGANIL